jgi:hypothetical protein
MQGAHGVLKVRTEDFVGGLLLATALFEGETEFEREWSLLVMTGCGKGCDRGL